MTKIQYPIHYFANFIPHLSLENGQNETVTKERDERGWTEVRNTVQHNKSRTNIHTVPRPLQRKQRR